ncbi:MAG: hypothetical protein NC833_00635 [Candidatus Omnitrophica bacterium]|nr:hypothetical protein [Candidatus Omnitrophota bacterium]
MEIKLWRSFLIGGFFSFIICFVDPIRVLVSKGASLTSDYSIGAAFFYFFIIVVINGILGKINNKFSLKTEELGIIFGMMAVSCAIPTWGFALNLIPLLPGVYYYADPSWEENFIPYINKKITVSDKNAINWFFEGLPKGYRIPWDKWILPLTFWFILIFSVYLLSILIIYFLSKRWIEEERLLYPLITPPTELSKKENSFPPIMKDKLFYIGILIPFIILSLNCISYYFPTFPKLYLSKTYLIFRKTLGINIRIAFEVIGLIYFVSLDVSLSLWFFYLLLTIQKGIFNITGIIKSTPEPWAFSGIEAGYECMGAMFAMILIILFQERNYLKSIFFDRRNIIYTIISLICFFTIVFWLNFIGLKFIHSLIFTIITFLTFIGLTRVVCQTGSPYGRSGVVPAGMLINIFGTERIGNYGLTALGFTSPWACDLRTLVMTSSASFFALGEKFKINFKKIIFACIISVSIGLFTSFFSIIRIAYKYGGINLGGWQFTHYVPYTVNWVKEYILHPYSFGRYEFSFFSIGAFLYIILNFLRLRFIGFPIHPIGLTIAATIPIYFIWFSIFIGWLLKFLILKYGGQKLYKKLQPLFIGIVFGAFLTGGVWMIIDFITGQVPGTHPILGS